MHLAAIILGKLSLAAGVAFCASQSGSNGWKEGWLRSCGSVRLAVFEKYTGSWPSLEQGLRQHNINGAVFGTLDIGPASEDEEANPPRNVPRQQGSYTRIDNCAVEASWVGTIIPAIYSSFEGEQRLVHRRTLTLYLYTSGLPSAKDVTLEFPPEEYSDDGLEKYISRKPQEAPPKESYDYLEKHVSVKVKEDQEISGYLATVYIIEGKCTFWQKWGRTSLGLLLVLMLLVGGTIGGYFVYQRMVAGGNGA